MELVRCFLIRSITMSLAVNFVLVDQHQSTLGSTKKLTSELALKRGLEPSFIGVFSTTGFAEPRDCHRTIELRTILGVEIRPLGSAAEASHIHPVGHRCDCSATHAIQEGTIVANTEGMSFLLTPEGDLDNRTIVLKGVDCDMAGGRLVFFVFGCEAKIVKSFLVRPTFALGLTFSSAQSRKVLGWLLAPGVLVIAIVHAVHMVLIRLNTHACSIILNPLAGLTTPTIAPVGRCTLNENLIPAETLHVIRWEKVALRLDRSEVINNFG